MGNEEKTARGKIRDAFDSYVIFYILAIILSIAGVYFILPLVFAGIANKIVAAICCFLLIPLIRAITESLINYHQFSIRFFVKQYLLALNFLVFGLILVVLALPIILSEFAVVIGGIVVCIFAIFVALGLIQNGFGVSFGRHLPADEIQMGVQILAIAAITEAVFIALKMIRAKFDNDIFDLFAYVYATGVDWIERNL